MIARFHSWHIDLLEKDGEDLLPLPLIDRKRRLQHLVSKVKDGIEFTEYLHGDSIHIFKAACILGHEASLQSAGIYHTRAAGPGSRSRSRTRIAQRCGDWKMDRSK